MDGWMWWDKIGWIDGQKGWDGWDKIGRMERLVDEIRLDGQMDGVRLNESKANQTSKQRSYLLSWIPNQPFLVQEQETAISSTLDCCHSQCLKTKANKKVK